MQKQTCERHSTQVLKPNPNSFLGIAEVLLVKAESIIFLRHLGSTMTHAGKVLETVWSPLKAFVALHIINGSYQTQHTHTHTLKMHNLFSSSFSQSRRRITQNLELQNGIFEKSPLEQLLYACRGGMH